MWSEQILAEMILHGEELRLLMDSLRLIKCHRPFSSPVYLLVEELHRVTFQLAWSEVVMVSPGLEPRSGYLLDGVHWAMNHSIDFDCWVHFIFLQLLPKDLLCIHYSFRVRSLVMQGIIRRLVEGAGLRDLVTAVSAHIREQVSEGI